MHNTFKVLVCSCIVFFTFSTSQAAWMPSFDPISSSWFATHIVVAQASKTFDGNFTILESCKGDLKKGETLWIPELALFASEKERKMSDGFGESKNNKFVTGQRIILFLRRMEYPWRNEAGRRDEWLPANRDGMFMGLSKTRMDVSIAWIENEGVYGRRQFGNPGPYYMSKYFANENDARKSIDEVLSIREHYDAALSEKDNSKRVTSLRKVLVNNQPKYPVLSFMAWQSLIEDRSFPPDFFQDLLKNTPELDDQAVKMLEALQKRYDQQVVAEKQVISIFDSAALLKALQRASAGWRDPKEKPPAPYVYFVDLWSSVYLFLRSFHDNKPMMREMSLNERKELLAITEEVLQYLNKTPPNVYYRDGLRWMCEQLVKELKPAVPAMPAAAK